MTTTEPTALGTLCAKQGTFFVTIACDAKKKDTEIKADEAKVNLHHTKTHWNKKLNFTCEVCRLKFANGSDAGLHYYYVHTKAHGWWNVAIAPLD